MFCPHLIRVLDCLLRLRQLPVQAVDYQQEERSLSLLLLFSVLVTTEGLTIDCNATGVRFFNHGCKKRLDIFFHECRRSYMKAFVGGAKHDPRCSIVHHSLHGEDFTDKEGFKTEVGQFIRTLGPAEQYRGECDTVKPLWRLVR